MIALATILQKIAAVLLIVFNAMLVLTVLGSDFEYQLHVAAVGLIGIGTAVLALAQPRDGFRDNLWNWWLVGTVISIVAIGFVPWLRSALDSPTDVLIFGNIVFGIVALLHLLLIGPEIWRRNKKFSLRRLSLVVLAFAAAGSLLANAFHWRVAIYNLEKPIAEDIRKLGGYIHYENWQIVGVGLQKTKVQDADLLRVAELKSVRSMDISDTKLTEASVPVILRMQSLRHLYLHGTAIGDEAKKRIRKEMPGIRINYE